MRKAFTALAVLAALAVGVLGATTGHDEAARFKPPVSDSARF